MQNHADRAAHIHDVPCGGRLAEYPGTRSVLPVNSQPARRVLDRLAASVAETEDVRHGLIHRAAYLNHVPVDNVNGIAAASLGRAVPGCFVLCLNWPCAVSAIKIGVLLSVSCSAATGPSQLAPRCQEVRRRASPAAAPNINRPIPGTIALPSSAPPWVASLVAVL